MIAGLGVDIVDVERVRALYERFGPRLAERLLAPSEQAQYRRADDPARLVAKRFAAKEAGAKALGTGIGQGVRFRDLATEHAPTGAPRLALVGRAREIADRLGITRVHLSVSDERATVVAFVILETTQPSA